MTYSISGSFKILKKRIFRYLVMRNDFIRDAYDHLKKLGEGQNKKNSLRLLLFALYLNLGYLFFVHKKSRAEKDITVIRRKERRGHGLLTEGNNMPCLTDPESSLSGRQSVAYYAKKMLLYDVISFDVFDTLLLLPFDRPTALFFLLSLQYKCPGFEKYRILAEKEARQKAFKERGSTEVTLEEIYVQLNRFVSIDPVQGAETEFQLEKKLLYANPMMLDVFKIAKQLGKTVIAVSDMYFSRKCIEELLKNAGFTGVDKIYVSLEHKTSKRKWELYNIIKTEMGTNLSYLHIGGNLASNDPSVLKAGLNVELYQNVHSIGKRYRPNDLTALYGSAYCGIVNAKFHSTDEIFSAPFEYGYAYAGQLTMGYCGFIHQFCREKQVDKILFLSRDGYLLKKGYGYLFPEEEPDYVYWSRACATQLLVDDWPQEFLLRYVRYKIHHGITIEKMALAMDVPGLIEQLEKLGLTADMLLTPENYDLVADTVRQCFPYIIQAYEAREEAAKIYFSDLLRGCKKVCIIDIGWAASGFSALKYLVEKKWGLNCQLYGLVVGAKYLHDGDILDAQLADGTVQAYCFAPNLNRYQWKTHNVKKMYSAFMETMLSAPMPSFAWYELERGRPIPRFEMPETEGFAMIEEIQQGAMDFIHDFTKHFSEYPFLWCPSGSDVYTICRHIISHVRYYKTLLGNYPVNRAVGTWNHHFDTLETLIKREYR